MLDLLFFLIKIIWLLIITVSIIGFITVMILRTYVEKYSTKKLESHKEVKNGMITVGFFHPYCNAGGGGERVLWVAIRALQKRYPNISIVVYTGDCDASPEQILNLAAQRFNIVLEKPIDFVFLTKRKWVEASMYPHFTLLGQSIGSLILGWEAISKFVPDIFIDSMGYAFTLPLFHYIGNSHVACYVHYPTISTDMLQVVKDGSQTYNNNSNISRSVFLTQLKVGYYNLFAFLYGLAGSCSQRVLVNSTWTRNHIDTIWKKSHRTFIVYPPCDITDLASMPLNENILNSKVYNIVSVNQFRPEKNHELQIKSFHEFLLLLPEEERKKYNLILIGGCRNDGDRQRVDNLKSEVLALDLSDQVEFLLNIPYNELKNHMNNALIGLHTMWNEHFGIGVVEMMAAGTVVLAHDSGGPKLDIVTEIDGEKTGFLASDIESYSKAMQVIANQSKNQRTLLLRRARKSVERFREEKFEVDFTICLKILIKSKEIALGHILE